MRRHRVVRRWERRRIRRRLGCPLAVVPLAVTTGVVSVVWVALP